MLSPTEYPEKSSSVVEQTMADQESLQVPDRGPGKTAKGRARLLSSRRRAKSQLSCNFCRQRKLKCDREQPCDSCSIRGVGHACAYVSNQPKGQPILYPGLSVAAKSGEEAVDTSSPTSDCGSMQVTGACASYVNSTHWAAILDSIAEIKDQFEKEKDEEEAIAAEHPTTGSQASNWTCPQLLYGCPGLATKEEILMSIPARPVVDRLISRYFNSFEMSPAVLHSVQFLREYEEFWENPSETPVIWLGLLFTLMSLATQFQKFRLEPEMQHDGHSTIEHDLETMMVTFRQKTVQCLILGNYGQGGPHVLETLMLYIVAELLSRNDAEIVVWILLGTIVQLAMHMGYHRDPKHFKDLSPFTGEMRKRVWATLVELDLTVSAQMGLPRLIKQWQTDTGEPSNYQDADFDKTTVELPPARPETELTPMLYRLVKARITNTIGLIWDFAADVRQYTYAEVTRMETMLQAAHSSIPDCIKWRSMAHCITDSPQLIMQKLFLDIIFYRARIVLHRKHMHCSSTKGQHSHSQQACLNAALRLLDYQHIIQGEIHPFGRLYQDRWRVSSVVNHDFLLATSVLCSYLQQQSTDDPEASSKTITEAVREALIRSHDIWLQSSSSSKEARRAAKALSVILERHPAPDSDTGMGIPFDVFDISTTANWDNSQSMAAFPATTPSTTTIWQMMNTPKKPTELMKEAENLHWPDVFFPGPSYQ